MTLEESAFSLPGPTIDAEVAEVERAPDDHAAVETSSILFLMSLLATALQSVSSLAVAAALTPGERGNYTLAVNVPVLVVVLVSGGLLYSVPYLVRKGGLPASAIGIGFAATIVSSALVGSALAAAFWLHPAGLFEGADHVTALTALGAAVLSASLAYTRDTAIGFGAVRPYVTAILTQPVLLIALLAVLLVTQDGLSAESSAAAWLGSVLLVTAYASAVLVGIARTQPRSAHSSPRRRRVLQQVLGYSWRAQAATLLQHLAYRSDLLFVAAMLSSYQLGLYAIATFLAEVAWIPSSAASQALFADLLGTASVRRTLLGIQNSLALTSVFGAAVLAGSALLFAGLLSEYAPALPATAILIPGVVLASVSRPYAAHLMALGRAKDAVRFSAWGAVAGLVLYPLAILGFGILGAASATTAVYALQAVRAVLALRRESPDDWTMIFRVDQGCSAVLRAVSAQLKRRRETPRTEAP